MRILIELPTWLGDTVMATPAIENLIKFNKQSEFIIVGTENSVEILKKHPNISEKFILNRNYSSLFFLSRKLGRIDQFFSFRNSFRSKVFKLLVNSKLKFFYQSKLYKNIHQVEKYIQFINNSLKADHSIGPLIIHSNGSFDTKYNSEDKTKPILAINPGASYGIAKRWYPSEFAEVIMALSRRYDTIILGGPDEKEIAFEIQKLIEKKGVKNYKNLAGKLSIHQLINKISNVDLFITGDSGPMHIAANFKVPTISIFGPTRSTETSQWKNDKGVILQKNLPCQPCMQRECPLEHNDCMKLIKARDVLTEIESLSL